MKIPQQTLEDEGRKSLLIVVLSVLFAGVTNWFIVPYGLYSGGILGFCQLIRTLITEATGVKPPFDYAGLLYYAVNIPIMIVVSRLMGKRYFAKTILCVTAQSLGMALIPIPSTIPIASPLAAVLVGGILRGALVGLCMKYGANDGGMDLVAILMLQKDRHITVGNLNLIINAALYIAMGIHFNLTTVVYSLISSAMMAYALDRFYSQGINVEVHIITRQDPGELYSMILKELHRSVTTWDGMGIYAGKPVHILYVVLNKYEVAALRRLVRLYEPDAFLVETQGVTVGGNFEKHLG